MSNKERLPLPMDRGDLYVDLESFDEKKYKLEEFIAEERKIKTKTFAKNVLALNEVQSNNRVESYYDDIEKINFIVKNRRMFKSTNDEDKKRILNLSTGYNYILKREEINKENLKKLYGKLSKDLLSEDDLKNMGEFYRLNDVYIYFSDNMCKAPDLGVSPLEIEYKMDCLFDFINNYKIGDTLTDEYIKSQIIHFYFVYVHPYYDINGRTARTTSLWHLLNENANPYVIFNRGIQIDKSNYYKVIREVKQKNDIKLFLDFMMDSVMLELKKEHVLQKIKADLKTDLSDIDYQTLHYLLSINGICTVLDFARVYNSFNEKKNIVSLYEQMILPLLEKEIIIPGRSTKKNIFSGTNNFVLGINEKYIDDQERLEGISIIKKEGFYK